MDYAVDFEGKFFFVGGTVFTVWDWDGKIDTVPVKIFSVDYKLGLRVPGNEVFHQVFRPHPNAITTFVVHIGQEVWIYDSSTNTFFLADVLEASIPVDVHFFSYTWLANTRISLWINNLNPNLLKRRDIDSGTGYSFDLNSAPTGGGTNHQVNEVLAFVDLANAAFVLAKTAGD